jgi:hypothetical protein
LSDGGNIVVFVLRRNVFAAAISFNGFGDGHVQGSGCDN